MDTITEEWQAIRGGYVKVWANGIQAQIMETGDGLLWEVGHEEPEIIGHSYTPDDASRACEEAARKLMEAEPNVFNVS